MVAGHYSFLSLIPKDTGPSYKQNTNAFTLLLVPQSIPVSVQPEKQNQQEVYIK